jgi:hypothetical protein
VGGEVVWAVAEQDDVVGPLAQQDGDVLAAGAGGENGEALAAVLEAVAVRAGARAGAPHVGEAGDIGDLVGIPVARRTVLARSAPRAEMMRTAPSSTSASWTSAVTTSTP